MPTISADRGLGAAAALLLLASGSAAAASGTIEIDPKYEKFESSLACEGALVRRYTAAVARRAALPEAEQRRSRVGDLWHNDEGHFTFLEWLDLTVELPDAVMPRSQTETFTCRGSTLEHRVDYESTGRHRRSKP